METWIALILALTLMLLASCRSQKEAVERTDSTIVNSLHYEDSLYTNFNFEFDSLEITFENTDPLQLPQDPLRLPLLRGREDRGRAQKGCNPEVSPPTQGDLEGLWRIKTVAIKGGKLSATKTEISNIDTLRAERQLQTTEKHTKPVYTPPRYLILLAILVAFIILLSVTKLRA